MIFQGMEARQKGNLPFLVPCYREKRKPAKLRHNTALHSPSLKVMAPKRLCY